MARAFRHARRTATSHPRVVADSPASREPSGAHSGTLIARHDGSHACQRCRMLISQGGNGDASRVKAQRARSQQIEQLDSCGQGLPLVNSSISSCATPSRITSREGVESDGSSRRKREFFNAISRKRTRPRVRSHGRAGRAALRRTRARSGLSSIDQSSGQKPEHLAKS